MKEEKRGFDAFARQYDEKLDERVAPYGFSSSSYFDEQKVRHMAGFLNRLGAAVQPLAFLNFGCGIGKSEPYIRRYLSGSVIYSVDVSGESIAVAREKNKDLSNVFFSVFDGVNVPFEADFDVIMAANVFHHIPRGDHAGVLRSLRGRLKKGGHIFIFEHNPLNPLTRLVVRSCAFDEDAVLLGPCYARRILRESGFELCKLQFIVFFPEALSLLLPLEALLHAVPFGAQYCVVASNS